MTSSSARPFYSSADARAEARRRLPRVLFEYLDGGAGDERTLLANTRDFENIGLRQRVLVDASRRSLACTLLGKRRAAPLVLGPVGFAGAFCRDGEILAARAAHRFELPYCLSMFSVNSLGELRRATQGELWMQVYITRDRTISDKVIASARALDVETLCVTVDTPAGAIRQRDVKTGMRGATRLTPRIAASLLARPRWCLGMAGGGMPKFGNLEGLPALGRHAFEQSSRLAQQIDPALSWSDIRTLRDQWRGKLVVKGVLDAADAAQAAATGVDAIVVSNHGGRQLDGVCSTISRLQDVARRCDTRCEVMLDSGIRRGVDVVKALALGARGVLIGRPYAYALAAGGQQAVEDLLSSLLAEIDSGLAHLGQPDVTGLTPDNLVLPGERLP